MKGIKVNIQQLGRVRDSELEILPLMVFSGESGLGKSYLSLLSHYFFEILVNHNRLDYFFAIHDINFDAISQTFTKQEGVATTIKKSDLENWMAQDAIHYIGYMLGHNEVVGKITVSLPDTFPATLVFKYKKDTTKIIDNKAGGSTTNLDNIMLTLDYLSCHVRRNIQFDESPFAFLLRYVMTGYLFENNYTRINSTFVLPPSRGPMLTETIIPTTGMYIEFQKGLQELNKAKPRPVSVFPKVQSLFYQIMEGNVDRVESTYIYKTDENVTMPVSAAAASIREIAPLQMLVQKQDIESCAILLEEPEAHLHSLKQRAMADIVGALTNEGAIMQITTHSDYFIRRLNELIMYSKAKHKKGVTSEQLEALGDKIHVNDDIAIDENNIAAYLLERIFPDGTSKIVRQDLKNGIPFESFREALISNIENQNCLEDFLEDEIE